MNFLFYLVSILICKVENIFSTTSGFFISNAGVTLVVFTNLSDRNICLNGTKEIWR